MLIRQEIIFSYLPLFTALSLGVVYRDIESELDEILAEDDIHLAGKTGQRRQNGAAVAASSAPCFEGTSTYTGSALQYRKTPKFGQGPYVRSLPRKFLPLEL